ncbi:uncharacterized protein LOC133810264 [Humulus lupulus]|uniref:uncharacterized protein LOC133810264 n=1 Tax=Humulus lupulus TaxID=3486 RepID=UPI002B408D97|nr:uncharacterized protein LOC133810264 [Humulus lupulus]
MASKKAVVECPCPCPEVVAIRRKDGKYLIPGIIDNRPYLFFIETTKDDPRILFEIRKHHHSGFVCLKSIYVQKFWYRTYGEWIIPDGCDECNMDTQLCIVDISNSGPEFVVIYNRGNNKFCTCRSAVPGSPECLIANQDGQERALVLEVVHHPQA